MTTKLSIWGSAGKIVVDRQECQVYLREPHAGLPKFKSGWTVRYTTDLTEEVWFYLRGEEYSAQIDYFIKCISGKAKPGLNTFRSALETDRVVEMLTQSASS